MAESEPNIDLGYDQHYLLARLSGDPEFPRLPYGPDEQQRMVSNPEAGTMVQITIEALKRAGGIDRVNEEVNELVIASYMKERFRQFEDASARRDVINDSAEEIVDIETVYPLSSGSPLQALFNSWERNIAERISMSSSTEAKIRESYRFSQFLVAHSVDFVKSSEQPQLEDHQISSMPPTGDTLALTGT